MEQRIIECFGRKAVITEVEKRVQQYEGIKLDNPNFMGTGMALSGFINPNETIEQFNVRVKNRFKQLLLINDIYFKSPKNKKSL